MKVVADSHAIVWYIAGSDRLSDRAAKTLREAEEKDGLVVSVATLVDLWYVTQTTRAVTTNDLDRLRRAIDSASTVTTEPIDARIADACTAIPRTVLTDPWDRFIVATAKVLQLPLVTRDGPIQKSKLVLTIW